VARAIGSVSLAEKAIFALDAFRAAQAPEPDRLPEDGWPSSEEAARQFIAALERERFTSAYKNHFYREFGDVLRQLVAKTR
jgi:hypothetical protein